MKMRLSIVLILLLAVISGGGWFLWQRASADQGAVMMTAPVTRGDVEVTVLAEGKLKPRRLVAVGAQVSGRILAVDVTLGQTVRQGDLVARIDSVTQANELRTARARLADVQAQMQAKEASLELAESTLERESKMLESRVSARSSYDTAVEAAANLRAQITALSAQITQAEVAIETAEANLSYTRITAPIDGTVLAIVNQEGQTVNAVQSAPTIVVLGQLDQMTVHAEISEADVTRVAPGQQVWFTILGAPERRYEAVLEAVAPAPDSIVNDSTISNSTSDGSAEAIYYDGTFTVPNADGNLRTYMTAEVHIVLGSARDVLTIPAIALGPRDREGRHTVQVQADDGSIAPRQISIGLNDKVVVEVTDGLSEGERVVTGQGSGAGQAGPGGGPRRFRAPHLGG